MAFRVFGREGMREPFIRRLVDVEQAAEGFDRRYILCTPIDQRALLMIEWPSLRVALDNLEPEEGTQFFRHPPDMRKDRKVAPQSVAALKKIVEPKQDKNAKYCGPRGQPRNRLQTQQAQDEQCGDCEKRNKAQHVELPVVFPCVPTWAMHCASSTKRMQAAQRASRTMP
ncbi:MAG: hypothetical protein ACI93G_000795 [Hyphomonas sp.]|jgi:hypothetical protein